MKTRRHSWTVTWVELGVLLFLTLLIALVFSPAITPAFEAQRRAMCQDNLRQLGAAFLMYAREDPAGRLPRMHGYEDFGAAPNAPGCVNVYDDFDFGPDMTVLYPYYVEDPLLLVCPSGPHGKRPWLLGSITIGSIGYKEGAIDATGLVHDDGSGECAYTDRITNGDVSYTYLPWVVGHDTPGFYESPIIDEQTAAEHSLPMSGPAQLVALAIQLHEAQTLEPAQSWNVLDEDIDLTEVLGMLGDPYVHAGCNTGRETQTVLRRTWREVERELLDPPVSYLGPALISQAAIPILFDRVTLPPAEVSHVFPGGNVLYLDGHVEFVKYPTRFPASESWIRLTGAVRPQESS